METLREQQLKSIIYYLLRDNETNNADRFLIDANIAYMRQELNVKELVDNETMEVTSFRFYQRGKEQTITQKGRIRSAT